MGRDDGGPARMILLLRPDIGINFHCAASALSGGRPVKLNCDDSRVSVSPIFVLNVVYVRGCSDFRAI